MPGVAKSRLYIDVISNFHVKVLVFIGGYSGLAFVGRCTVYYH